MHLQVCRMIYEDAEGIGPEDIVSLKEAGRLLGIKQWSVSQLVDDGELTLLVDADAPKGWAWRFLLLRSEVQALAASRSEQSAAARSDQSVAAHSEQSVAGRKPRRRRGRR